MRPFSLVAALTTATVLTLHGAAQQPPRTAQPQPRTAAPPARTAPAQPPRRDAAVPFSVGETLTYDVAWSTYLIAGTATSKVVEKRPSMGSNAYYIVAEGRPLPLIARLYALYYKMDSLLDTVTTLSQQSSLYMEEGSSRHAATTTFNRGTKRAVYQVEATPPERNEFTIPQNVQDGLATLYDLRSRTFKAGDRFAIPVADEGSLYNVAFDVTGPVPMRLPLGQMDAWKLAITILDAANQPVGNNIAAWISTDARRLPLRLQADLPVGSFALGLRSVQ
jgi:hypothetical protein